MKPAKKKPLTTRAEFTRLASSALNGLLANPAYRRWSNYDLADRAADAAHELLHAINEGFKGPPE